MLIPSCKEVAEQLSENMDKPVTGIRGLRLKLHLWVCRNCRRYHDQMELTSKTIALMGSNKQPSEAVKKDMMERFRDAKTDSGKESAAD
ncbi:hypothetical protein FLL45_12420 [Aliikangiella marina]|uniref:Putative zinc-finger domain-containing protein n=1 Tax=Aliikangiella marina TaxID=1712262 RepID=A0A545T8Y5_9GAMM|nr:hypothetical protein [Aliikangiella marina]TQV73671.1 hypothetical protein FLL45_12420 [Aliikangiella marina]